MSQAHFEFEATLDRAKPTKGTLTIDRKTGMVEVRPHRSRRVFSIPLEALATMVVQRAIMQEVREKQALRPRRRLAKRGLLSNTP